ncbi:recombinase family protein [Massilia sp. Dwa41.01b]|uniref:recombinase family protein n=1 Tax=unclassified Massilia TaxID=2609279 RepID=UPI0015FEEEF5|nr:MULTISPECIES: recombinase family protein [unclassified Massilia]QNA90836.1 recombinase family protein [Massilia sp. Dwa41.01b]QNA98079.1 recombinase family protein [Massilia sp. Se16.2.3]
MLIGYARTSTVEQVAGFDAQLSALKAEGCERVFQEQVSSVAERRELEEAIGFARSGDVFVVTKLDRLARNTQHLLEIVQRLEAKGVSLKVLNLGLDTSTPTGKLMLTMLGAVGQFEREIMLERQKEGVAKAKAEGKYKGRKPTAQAKKAEVLSLVAQGLTKDAVADKLGIGVASVYRMLKA